MDIEGGVAESEFEKILVIAGKAGMNCVMQKGTTSVVSAMKKVLAMAAVICLMAGSQNASAIIYVSNLNDVWTESGIGDFTALFPGSAYNGSVTTDFLTGDGYYSLNTLTLEFGLGTTAAAPQYMNIQLFDGSSLVGTLGNPVANPQPTHWPGTTEFFDFSPQQPIILSPCTDYTMVASLPASSPIDATVLSTDSYDFVGADGWFLGDSTYSTLDIAVDATPVPEPGTASLWLSGLAVVLGRRLFHRK
jgi:hypothetical protein